MIPIDLQVVVQLDTPAVLPDTVTFECGASRAEVSDPNSYAYEHHGSEFGQTDPGALTSFFEDLVLGRPMPLKFATRIIQDVDTVLAIALFLQRDLAIAPTIPGLVASVDLVHRRGLPLLGHLDRDLGGFLRYIRRLFPNPLSRRELGDRLGVAVRLVRDYALDGQLPSVDLGWPAVQILERGTSGFVLGRTTGPLVDGWVELFREGHLKGFLVGPEENGCRTVCWARKSAWVGFDLERAQVTLNELEEAAMGLPEWHLLGDFLWSPSKGTVLDVSSLLMLAVRL